MERLAQFRDEIVSNAGADAWFKRGDEWSPVAAQRITNEGQTLCIDLRARHHIVDHKVEEKNLGTNVFSTNIAMMTGMLGVPMVSLTKTMSLRSRMKGNVHVRF